MTDQNNPDPQGSEALSIPEKFQAEDGSLDAQKILKSYTDLEAMTTQSRQAPKGAESGAIQIPDPRSDGPLTPEKFQESFGDYLTEFQENGELSDDSWKVLESKTGFSRDFIEDWAESKKIAEVYQTQKAFEPYGGQDAVNEAIDWASKNIPADEVTQINEDFQAGGRLGQRALEDLMNRYTTATGGTDAITPRAGTRAPGVQGFSSKAERQAAMKTARATGDMSEYNARLDATTDPASLS